MLTDELRQPESGNMTAKDGHEQLNIEVHARTEDEDAIRGIVKGREDAWNAGDGRGFGEAFADDVDYVVINGMYVKGRDAVDAGHQQIFDTIYKGSNLATEVEGIRFIRPDVAYVRVRGIVKYGQGEVNSRSTWVLSKDNGQWRIVVFQNTPIAGE